MPFRDYRKESRTAWGANQEENLNREQIQLGAILRIADALEALNNKLDCYRVTRALDAVHRMDRRMAQRRPLGGRKKA